jgi:hypothetical protein
VVCGGRGHIGGGRDFFLPLRFVLKNLKVTVQQKS